ncbi:MULTISPECIES: siderophore-interacting protein [Achromobacter]|uniref:Siderophore-interacting protein n=1 Tax=Alcaligenes xylosoxydans xylosoxydans TaxID=85698 RepID=A0A424WJL5_ALCXX|nr:MULTISPECIES: siderophore-interacting protein [Achromobacter]MBC9904183.1 siderophore-interacting protein [Achromobacter xylosoxidans]MBD0867858.1 siderophore-interacting protein [Achromobacter xylosoxidans]MDH1302410.1 siderophore-interacting protein [Achromobacter sp. GD03932]QNP86520.1 siderophore-interacting protein [Achromobacter xylosoxidans]RPJ93465.1 siderophore-interacting protein [Achromobacter xylosoxidans]
MTRNDLNVERVRHNLKMRTLTVASVERVAGLMARVTFTGDELQDFVSASFDDHVKLFFPADPSLPPALPAVTPDGIKFPEGAPKPAARDYTPRFFDAARKELVIDFVLHGDGPASTWAEQAEPGQQLGIGGPRGSFVVPTGFDWHVLIGDETALPAIARRLEELPASAQALVLIEVPDASNEIPLATAAQASVRWLHRNGTAPGYSTLLLEAARELTLPPGEGYAWVAAESAAAKAVREIMVAQHGVDKSRIRAASYWKRGAVAVHESHEG